jgi:hypothetical protein
MGCSENNRKARYYSLTWTGLKQLAIETENWERISGVIGLTFRGALTMAVWIRAFVARLRQLFPQRGTNVELEDEIQLHLQMLKERFILQGRSPSVAEAAARRQFGNATLLRERCHEQRTLSIFATLARDLHFGLRQLRRNSTLTRVAIASLALGIGAKYRDFCRSEAGIV